MAFVNLPCFSATQARQSMPRKGSEMQWLRKLSLEPTGPELLHLSVPQFFHLQDKDNNCTCLIGPF